MHDLTKSNNINLHNNKKVLYTDSKSNSGISSSSSSSRKTVNVIKVHLHHRHHPQSRFSQQCMSAQRQTLTSKRESFRFVVLKANWFCLQEAY